VKRRWLVIASLLLGLWVPWGMNGAMAAAVRADDAQAIQTVVQLQLSAIADDDAASAFALATQETRSRIGSADIFLQMIKENYDPLYRSQNAIFSTPEVIDGSIIQIVRVTARDNKVWLAVYKMLRDDNDGTWKIDGCQLLETTSISV
jgi:hypothetical protein